MRQLTAHHDHCMGCGPENPGGLGLRFSVDDDAGRVHATLRLDRRHEGAPGFAHGGAVATALDDTLGTLLVVVKRVAVTARLEVDYRVPVLVRDEPYDVEAWVDHVDGRKLHLRAELRDGQTVLAEASALFLEVPLEHFGDDLPESMRAFWRESGEAPR